MEACAATINCKATKGKTMDDEYVQELNQIQIDLQELMNVGLVDIIGINEDGEWLYGLTEEGRKVVEGFDAA